MGTVANCDESEVIMRKIETLGDTHHIGSPATFSIHLWLDNLCISDTIAASICIYNFYPASNLCCTALYSNQNEAAIYTIYGLLFLCRDVYNLRTVLPPIDISLLKRGHVDWFAMAMLPSTTTINTIPYRTTTKLPPALINKSK